MVDTFKLYNHACVSTLQLCAWPGCSTSTGVCKTHGKVPFKRQVSKLIFIVNVLLPPPSSTLMCSKDFELIGPPNIKVRITCLTEVHIYPLINAQDSPTYIRAGHLPSEWWWICLCMCLYIAVVCMGRMWYRYGLCEAHAQVSFKRQVSTLLLIVSFLLLLPSFTPICRGRLRTDRSSWICLTQYMYITLSMCTIFLHI